MAFVLRYLTAVLFVATFFCLSASGQTVVNLSDTSAIYRLDNDVAIFIDSANSTTFETISAPEFQDRFLANEKTLVIWIYTVPHLGTGNYINERSWCTMVPRASSPVPGIC